MKSLLLVFLFSFAWGDKNVDLNRIYQNCFKTTSDVKSKLKIENNKIVSFCGCIKQKMDKEFSKPGDDVHLKLIADHVTGIDVKEQLAETEGAYVFMDLYLDIRQECAKENRKKDDMVSLFIKKK